jgi:hypothetical protein
LQNLGDSKTLEGEKMPLLTNQPVLTIRFNTYIPNPHPDPDASEDSEKNIP